MAVHGEEAYPSDELVKRGASSMADEACDRCRRGRISQADEPRVGLRYVRP